MKNVDTVSIAVRDNIRAILRFLEFSVGSTVDVDHVESNFPRMSLSNMGQSRKDSFAIPKNAGTVSIAMREKIRITLRPFDF